MPRYVWARVWCDLLRHRNFRRRPDCDKVLVVGLILHAKEHSGDVGLVEGLDAEDMRGLFGIKAPLQRVQEGLEYLLKIGWLQIADESGNYVIRDFVSRQSQSDSSEAQKLRAKRYYENNKDEILRRRKVSRGLTSEQASGLTSESHGLTASDQNGLTLESHAEVDGEEEEDHDRSAVGGESEGRIPTAPESVDNPQGDYANLSDSERSHFLRLWKEGKGSEATKYLASLKQPQVLEKIQKKRGVS